MLHRVVRRLRRPGSTDRPEHAAVRLVTYNLHHGADASGRLTLEAVADFLCSCDPDLVALQELDRFWGPRSGMADQPGELAGRLGMHLAYAPTISRTGRSAEDPMREYGSALLSRTPLHDVRQVPFPPEPGIEPRGYLVAETSVAGRRLRVVVTHLSTHGVARRRRQAELIRDDLATLEPLPTLVAGDLNAQAWQPAVRALGEIGVDAWSVAGRGPGATTVHGRPRRRIDYVYASAGLAVVGAVRPAVGHSDHYPVVVDLSFG